MDIRAGIVQRIITTLAGKADDSIINLVQNTLIIELNSYEVTEVAAMHLQEYLSGRKDSSEALFVGRGKHLKKNGVEAIIKKLGERAGVENAHPHRYHRALATNLLDRGMNIQDVEERLGAGLGNVRTAHLKSIATNKDKIG